MPSWELLQISDLHFGDLYPEDDRYPCPKHMRHNLRTNVEKCLRLYAKIGFPDALLITGDISIRGDDVALDLGLQALRPFSQKLISDGRVVGVVPGNHDVKWGLPPADSDHYEKKFGPFCEASKKLHGAVRSVIPFGNPDNPAGLGFQTPSEPVKTDVERKIVVICINSAMRSGEFNKKWFDEASQKIDKIEGKSAKEIASLKDWLAEKFTFDIAHVGHEQRELIAEKLTAEREKLEHDGLVWSDFLRVAIMHHHLVSIDHLNQEHKAFEAVVDSGSVLSMLAGFGVDLVLTGHKHRSYNQPYVVKRADDTAYEIVIAGGATVLGPLPEGAAHRGFTRIGVNRGADGKLALSSSVLPIYHPSEFEQALRSARSQGGQGPNRDVGSAGLGFATCALAGANLSDGADISNEWMMWLNVKSCANAEALIRVVVNSQSFAKSVKFASVYHLYGFYDLLVRVDLSGDSPPIETGDQGLPGVLVAIIEVLKERDELQASEVHDVLCACRVDPGGGDVVQTIWKQPEYESRRMQRAFLMGSTTMGEMDNEFRAEIGDILRKGCDGFTGVWSLHFSKTAFVLEATLTCGSYYDLQKITRKLERLLDYDPYNKKTHLAYSHYEWQPNAKA